MEPVLIVIATAVLIGVVFTFAARQMRKARDHWRAVAGEFGLDFQPGGVFKGMQMTGSIDGLSVRVHTVSRNAGNHSQLYTVVDVHPSAALPDGLRLHREGLGTKLIKALGGQDIPLADRLADEKLRVRGQDPAAVQAVLDHPAAVPALFAVMGGKGYTRFDDGKLTIEVTGYAIGEVAKMVRTAVDGARALDQAVQAPWAALAEAHGLRHEESWDSATLDGQIDGLPLLVRTQRSDERARTRVQVTLRGGLPTGVRIRAGEGGPRLGDPILDGRVIVESTTRDTAHVDAAIRWIQTRLQDPRHDLRGCLMDILQGMPGATVEAGTVHCELPRRAGPELADTVTRMVALGAALSDRQPPGGADPELERRRRSAAARQRS